MQAPTRFLQKIAFSIIALVIMVFPPVAYLNSTAKSLKLSTASMGQTTSLTILGPGNKRQPVVNEGNTIPLMVVDSAGGRVTDITYSSGSPEIATVDAQSGMVKGILQGFATITAQRSNGDTTSAFVVVARVGSSKGMKIMGENQKDNSSAAIYLSNPLKNLILKKADFNSDPKPFAGTGMAGFTNGNRLQQARFSGPIGLAIDSRALEGGIYVADTLNHSIRKIENNGNVKTTLGSGSPGLPAGLMMADSIKLDSNAAQTIQLSSPHGVALTNGNLYIADTDNSAIYLIDFQNSLLKLVAGQPGSAGFKDGKGRQARFDHPSSLTVRSDGTVAIADTGNNCIRLLSPNGTVASLCSMARASAAFEDINSLAANNLSFNAPFSVSSDGVGNIYVVDKNGVEIITFPQGQATLVDLAQPTITFNQAASVTVRGTEVFVLDAAAMTEDIAVKDVTVGAPQITDVSPDTAKVRDNITVVITGKNFAPETQVVLGDSPVNNPTIESATRISFTVPNQNVPGDRTLTVKTRGGVDQRKFIISPRPLSELADGEITTIAGGITYLGDGGLALSSTTALSANDIKIDTAGNLFITDTIHQRIRKVDASTGIITTVAGNGAQGFGGDGGPATSATLNFPRSIALDSEGNLFIADSLNNRIRKVAVGTGIITTIAGNGVAGFSGDNKRAIRAKLNVPVGITLDGEGNLFIADSLNQRIRKIDATTSIITTIAGNGNAKFSGDNGPAIMAELNFPNGLALDNVGNLYIADYNNSRIRKVDLSTSVITTVAGTAEKGSRGDGGLATNAELENPITIALDILGNLYIADLGNRSVRKVESDTGIITRVAGKSISNLGTSKPLTKTNKPRKPKNAATSTSRIANKETLEFPGDGGLAINAEITPPSLALDTSGNLFIADFAHNSIRRVDANTNIITTVAGSGVMDFSGDNGPATSAKLSPQYLALDTNGNLYIADLANNAIKKVDLTTGIITKVAGNGNSTFSGDGGLALNAGFSPGGFALDNANNIFITDLSSNRVRKVAANTGIITTIVGDGKSTFNGDNILATTASLAPSSIVLDKGGNLFISDINNNRIRRVDVTTGIITTVAGIGVSPKTGTNLGDDQPATKARLNYPNDIKLDNAGNLYIADALNHRIRKVAANTGIIDTIAGTNRGFSGDRELATDAELNFPRNIALDNANNLFIVDSANFRVRKVAADTGIITTIAGNGINKFSGDGGSALDAGMNPNAITIDKAGNLYIADTSSNFIRVVKGVAQGKGSTYQAIIFGVDFKKPTLTITGMRFGSFGAQVNINGRDVSQFIASQSDTSIVLQGSSQNLNLGQEPNTVTIIANGQSSNTFTFNLAIKPTSTKRAFVEINNN